MEVSVLVRELRGALREEMRAGWGSAAPEYQLYGGVQIGSLGAETLVEFYPYVEYRLPSDLTGRIEVNGTEYPCTVLQNEGLPVLLAVRCPAGVPLAEGVLRCQPAFLIQQLRERLQEITEPALNRNGDLPLKVLGYRPSRAASDVAAFRRYNSRPGNLYNPEQVRGIAQAMGSESTKVWAPPGSGKTLTIGGIARLALERLESVLITAPSHAGVDAAVLSVESALRDTDYLDGGKVLRIGVPSIDQVAQMRHILPFEVIRRRWPNLIDELELLIGERRRLCDVLLAQGIPDAERRRLGTRLSLIQRAIEPLWEEVSSREAELIASAQLIAVTLPKAAVHKPIFTRRFHSVLIDEGTMASLPQIVFASSLAQDRVVVLGDFRQLPPVCHCKKKAVRHWLTRDIFEFTGIAEDIANGRDHPQLVTLNRQYRMNPAIRSVVSRTFYGDMLTDGPNVSTDTAPIAALSPWPGEPLVLCDVGALVPRTRIYDPHERGFGSHFNIVSALVALDLAVLALHSGACRVACVSPYSAQARLLQTTLVDLHLEDAIQAGTAHKFQGGQWDVVIVDLVDCLPLPRPGSLVNGPIGSDGAKCLNVAMSRPRGKLLVVADLGYLRAHLQANSALLAFLANVPVNLIRSFGDSGSGGSNEERVRWFTEMSTALDAFRADFNSVRHNIVINSPTGLLLDHVNQAWLSTLDHRRVSISIAGASARVAAFEARGVVCMPPIGNEEVVLFDRTILWRFTEGVVREPGLVCVRTACQGFANLVSELTGLEQLLSLAVPEPVVEPAPILSQILEEQIVEQPTQQAGRFLPRLGVRKLSF